MKTFELLEKLNALSPLESALEWDNVGLLVGDDKKEVSKVYISLDISNETIDKAKDSGCDMIISHHPMIFHPIKKVTGDDVTGSRIIKLIENRINYIALHTNFDVHVMGKIVANRLGFTDSEVLEITEDEGIPRGIGTFSQLKKDMTLIELTKLVKEKFNLPYATFFGSSNDRIKNVAIVPGSGKGEIGIAKEKKCDVLITGDVSHHEGIDAVAAGINIIDAGHYGLEYIFMEYMRDYFDERLPKIQVVCENIEFPRRLV